MRGFHTAALVALVALALCAGGAADNNTPLTRGASNIGIAPALSTLNITATAWPRAQEAQGSDADEFTRGRRPNRGGKWEKPYGGKPHKNKHRPQWNKPPKHDEPDWCDASAFCDDHSDCNKQYPCKNTYCETSNKFRGKNWPKEGKCVCEGHKDGPCIPKPAEIIECTGPLGNCVSGECIPDNRDEGCACEPDRFSCVDTLIAEQLACLNEQPCKCDGSGTCAPNYVPNDTPCAFSTDDTIFPGVCETATCQSGTCTVNPTLNVGCFINPLIPECVEAGKCTMVVDNIMCVELPCIEPTPPEPVPCGDVEGIDCFGAGPVIGLYNGICCAGFCYVDQSDKLNRPTSCPCVSAGTCYNKNADLELGFCCEVGPSSYVCEVDEEACGGFCKNYGGNDAACNTEGRGCGEGNTGAQCDNLCASINPSASCVAAQTCKCYAVSSVASCDCNGNCANDRVDDTKCCYCADLSD